MDLHASTSRGVGDGYMDVSPAVGGGETTLQTKRFSQAWFREGGWAFFFIFARQVASTNLSLVRLVCARYHICFYLSFLIIFFFFSYFNFLFFPFLFLFY